jgi:hypothetical protein
MFRKKLFIALMALMALALQVAPSLAALGDPSQWG